MKLLVNKLYDDATVPHKSRRDDEGFDLFSAETCLVCQGETKKVSTGIAASVSSDDGKKYWLQVEGRSGMAAKNGVHPIGGIVDVGYTGEISVILANTSSQTLTINKGDKIAQLVIREHFDATIEEVEQLESSDRGDKGFGSSGT